MAKLPRSRPAKIKKSEHTNPDHSPERSRIRRIGGQIQAIERMIVERRYCPEIILQVRAASAALRSLESAILKDTSGTA